MGKRRERLTKISHKHAMKVAMERALEWSHSLDVLDEEDAEWERQFRERCRRYLDKLRGGKPHQMQSVFDNAKTISAYDFLMKRGEFASRDESDK